MNWDFTPADVVKGRVDYGLEHFRHDLMVEVGMNVPGLDRPELDRMFALIYDLTYWLATGKDFDEFAAQFESSGFTQAFLEQVRCDGQGNVDMLGAILQRLIMDRVESGFGLDGALADVARFHSSVASLDPVAAIGDAA